MRQFIKDIEMSGKAFIRYFYFSLYRAIFGKDDSRLALGKSIHAYKFPRWNLLDVKGSDINLNLEEHPYSIPLSDVQFCHSSHMFEHISDSAVAYLLEQVFLSMRDGGIIRIEVPSSDKILNDYRADSGRPIAKYFSQSNVDTLVNIDGFPDKYGELHIGTLGAISCIHTDLGNKIYQHIPVYVGVDEFEQKLNNLSNDDFSRWAINLQTEAERSQHGHINFWTESKMKEFLENAGFCEVQTCDPGISEHGFDLSIEREHRAFYSIIMEAKR